MIIMLHHGPIPHGPIPYDPHGDLAASVRILDDLATGLREEMSVPKAVSMSSLCPGMSRDRWSDFTDFLVLRRFFWWEKWLDLWLSTGSCPRQAWRGVPHLMEGLLTLGPRWDIMLVGGLPYCKGGLDLNQSTGVSSNIKYITSSILYLHR